MPKSIIKIMRPNKESAETKVQRLLQLNKMVERTKEHGITEFLLNKTRKGETSLARVIGAKTQLMKSPVSSRNIPMVT
jgi:hypothetical protein